MRLAELLPRLDNRLGYFDDMGSHIGGPILNVQQEILAICLIQGAKRLLVPLHAAGDHGHEPIHALLNLLDTRVGR